MLRKLCDCAFYCTNLLLFIPYYIMICLPMLVIENIVNWFQERYDIPVSILKFIFNIDLAVSRNGLIMFDIITFGLVQKYCPYAYDKIMSTKYKK